MGRPKMTEEQKAEAAARRRAEQVAGAVEAVEPVESPEVAAPIPTLEQYIKSKERDGIVLVRVTYPGAKSHVYPGIFSGVVVDDGPLSSTYSDGSTIY